MKWNDNKNWKSAHLALLEDQKIEICVNEDDTEEVMEAQETKDLDRLSFQIYKMSRDESEEFFKLSKVEKNGTFLSVSYTHLTLPTTPYV